MKTFERYFLAANKWALIVVLSTMSLIIFANVVLRYSSGMSLSWAEEVARHLMIWLTFLGLGPVLRYGGHIAVENLQDALPTRFAVVLRVLIAVLLFAFFVFLIYFGAQYLDRTQYQRTPATQISFAYIYAALPVGAVIAFVHWALVVKDYVRNRTFASDAHFSAADSASL